MVLAPVISADVPELPAVAKLLAGLVGASAVVVRAALPISPWPCSKRAAVALPGLSAMALPAIAF
jgi:hypothetical protein